MEIVFDDDNVFDWLAFGTRNDFACSDKARPVSDHNAVRAYDAWWYITAPTNGEPDDDACVPGYAAPFIVRG